MLRWVSITPLGMPVLPLEKITVASDVCASPRARTSRVEMADAGSTKRRHQRDDLRDGAELLHHVLEEHHAVHRLDGRPSRGTSAT